MKTSERPSKQVHGGNSLHQHLHIYALAASAAGVSMLALAQPGEAEIIYTPANVSIGLNQWYYLDLNGDGTTDFGIINRYRFSTFTTRGTLLARPAQTGNEIVLASSQDAFAAALRAGASIGPNDKFSSQHDYWGWIMAAGSVVRTSHHSKQHCRGPWKNKNNHYLGLKFMISGEVHYGWARLSVSCVGDDVTAELTGYAYETIPNTGIVAGKKKGKLEDESLTEPAQPTPSSTPASTSATLGMLAKGAQALSIWRRE